MDILSRILKLFPDHEWYPQGSTLVYKITVNKTPVTLTLKANGKLFTNSLAMVDWANEFGFHSIESGDAFELVEGC